MTIEDQPRPRIEWLDYSRFLSAVAVLLFHYFKFGPENGVSPALLAPAPIPQIASFGFLGVDFFFIVSGFVITMSLRGRTAGQFAVARVIRLYPGFVVCMTITTLVLGLGGHPVPTAQWLANLTMLANLWGFQNVDGVYWSLYFEILFYAAVWLILIARGGAHYERFVLVWIALQAISAATYRVPFFSGYYTLFAAGCVFSFARTDGWTRVRVLSIVVTLLLSLREAWLREPVLTHHQTGTAILVTLAFFAIFALFHRFDPRLPNARAIGALTYPLYLLHAEIGYVLLRIVPLPVVLAIVLLLAAVVAEFAERRPNRFYRRVGARALDRLRSVHMQRHEIGHNQGAPASPSEQLPR